MSTLRIHNIEAKSDSSSPSVHEKVKITNSRGDILLHIDGSNAGIASIGIGTTGTTFKVDADENIEFSGIVTASSVLYVGTAHTFNSGGANITGVVTATSFRGSGANLTGLASREIYGFTGIGSHLRLTYTNNGADNISGSDFAAFEDEFIGPSGISWSINNDGNLIATI